MQKVKSIVILVLMFFTQNILAQPISGLDSEIYHLLLRVYDYEQILDIRPNPTFQAAYIRNAINISFDDDDFLDRVNRIFDRQKPLFIYSDSGIEGKNAMLYLKGLGFKEVYFLSSGFPEWIASSKPYVSKLDLMKPVASYTMENLAKITNSQGRVLLYLGAPWCLHCKVMDPRIREYASSDKELKIQKINIDKEKAIAEHFNTYATPTFVYFVDGKQVWKHTGEISPEKLTKALSQ